MTVKLLYARIAASSNKTPHVRGRTTSTALGFFCGLIYIFIPDTLQLLPLLTIPAAVDRNPMLPSPARKFRASCHMQNAARQTQPNAPLFFQMPCTGLAPESACKDAARCFSSNLYKRLLFDRLSLENCFAGFCRTYQHSGVTVSATLFSGRH